MCGIAGYYNYKSSLPVGREAITRMNRSMVHRGPDAQDYYVNNNIALGNVRLSIVDLEGGKQPFLSDDRSLVLVFNGEIYNHNILRSELENLGARFRTKSDTEIVLRAYEVYGYSCVDKFIGCWSFGIWDEKRKVMFLSRDRIGEKPLYYAIDGGTFVFSSEMKGIFEYGFRKVINTELIELYLTLSYLPAPHTFYKNLYKLEPGTNLYIQNGNLRKEKYWDIPVVQEDEMSKDINDVAEEFKYLLDNSVDLQMQCDVPFGAFLSGGLDSSTIVSIMSGRSNIPIKTFTMSYDKRKDESELAERTAKYFNTEHHVCNIDSVFIEDTLSLIPRIYDEPFGDVSAIPLRLVSEFAHANGLKVVLTGDGGDEALSGYNIYRSAIVNQRLRFLAPSTKQIGISLLNALARVPSRSLSDKAKEGYRLVYPLFSDITDFLAFKHSWLPLSQRADILRQYKTQYHLEDFLRDSLGRARYSNDFYKIMYFDLAVQLPDQMLTKVDRMTMWNSLEVRVPFLDYRLVEFMSKVHKNVKLRNLQGKSVLREAYGEKLPPEILSQPKTGFGVPITDGMLSKTMNNLSKNIADFVDTGSLFDSSIRLQSSSRNRHLSWMVFVLNEFTQ